SERLATIKGVQVIVAGRDRDKAETQAQRIGAQSTRIDTDDQGLTNRLRSLGCNLVISTAGPFQGKAYRVPEAAIAADAHYIDLADARDYVCGITGLDPIARASDVLVVSGVSSVPALSSAVIDRYLPEFGELHAINYGISSSEKMPGVATVAAVLGYTGKPVRQWRDGAWQTVIGWHELSSHDFGGELGRRWLANCDIPDLELFPARYPGVRSVRFQAGLGLRVTQFGTWALSWLVRAGLIKSLSGLAPLLRRLAITLEPLGDGLSGMFVELSGSDRDGNPMRRHWQLIAGNNHGPNIPCMAAVALTRKLAAGQLPIRGAMPCVGLLTLDEYLAELTGFDIRVHERHAA
ncbi:MAG: saccharopine dehydrogenase family protein, partial [Nevskiales bacterium]